MSRPAITNSRTPFVFKYSEAIDGEKSLARLSSCEELEMWSNGVVLLSKGIGTGLQLEWCAEDGFELTTFSEPGVAGM